MCDQNEMRGRLLTVAELAEFLRISPRAAYRLARRVPHFRVGRGVRLRLDEALEALREDQR